MLFICFRFCLLCRKLKSVGHCLRGKLHHDAIHAFQNLETIGCTPWHSRPSIYEYFCLWVSFRGQFHIHTDEKSTPSSYHDVWGGLCLHSSSHAEAYIKCLKGYCLLGSKGWMLEEPPFSNRTLGHVPQTREPRVGREKIFVTISTLTSGHLTPQIAILLITICGGWGIKKSLCNTKEEQMIRITVVFVNSGSDGVYILRVLIS